MSFSAADLEKTMNLSKRTIAWYAKNLGLGGAEGRGMTRSYSSMEVIAILSIHAVAGDKIAVPAAAGLAKVLMAECARMKVEPDAWGSFIFYKPPATPEGDVECYVARKPEDLVETIFDSSFVSIINVQKILEDADYIVAMLEGRVQ